MSSNHLCFDWDFFKICVNMGTSCSMSDDLNHFQDILLVEHHVSGIGQQALQAKGKGTLVFKIYDNNDMTSIIKLPGSLYIPGLPCPLLVPRHWSEQARDEKPLQMEHVFSLETTHANCIGINGNTAKQSHTMALPRHLPFSLPPALSFTMLSILSSKLMMLAYHINMSSNLASLTFLKIKPPSILQNFLQMKI